MSSQVHVPAVPTPKRLPQNFPSKSKQTKTFLECMQTAAGGCITINYRPRASLLLLVEWSTIFGPGYKVSTPWAPRPHNKPWAKSLNCKLQTALRHAIWVFWHSPRPDSFYSGMPDASVLPEFSPANLSRGAKLSTVRRSLVSLPQRPASAAATPCCIQKFVSLSGASSPSLWHRQGAIPCASRVSCGYFMDTPHPATQLPCRTACRMGSLPLCHSFTDFD